MSLGSRIQSWVSLKGKTALVTGGSGGIGSAVVEVFGEAGAIVLNVDKKAPHRAGKSIHIPCDLSKPEEIRGLGSIVRAQTRSLDFFVHCAGIARDAVHWKMKEEDWFEVIQVNLNSAFQTLQICTPLLRERGGGAVVFVSSINGERGKFGQSNYAASKAALVGLARTAARELGRFGIRVNALAPGWIRTPMTEALHEEFLREAEKESALGRVGEPEDVARAALFLCSGLSRHITGQVLRVDGGQLMG